MEKTGCTFVLQEESKQKCINTSEASNAGSYLPNPLLKQSSQAIILTLTTYEHNFLPHRYIALYPLQGPINAL
jgi:hypothetical protein